MTRSIGGTGPDKSVVFNNIGPGTGAKEVTNDRDPGEKNEAEKAVKETEAAAAAKKKEDSKPVPITI